MIRDLRFGHIFWDSHSTIATCIVLILAPALECGTELRPLIRRLNMTIRVDVFKTRGLVDMADRRDLVLNSHGADKGFRDLAEMCRFSLPQKQASVMRLVGPLDRRFIGPLGVKLRLPQPEFSKYGFGDFNYSLLFIVELSLNHR